jgi:translation elongation factor EF-4
LAERPTQKAIQGFEDVKPMVFAGIYPVDTEDFEDLRDSMAKLQLNDASLVFEPESSAALGFWIPMWILRYAAHGNHSGATGTGVQHDSDYHGP